MNRASTKTKRGRRWLGLWIGGLSVLVLVSVMSIGRAQQVHRNGFESLQPCWTRGPADARYTEVQHETTDQGAHDGLRAECLKLDAKEGKHIYYQYPVGRAAVGDELNASVWLRASRPGPQLVARVVLPNESDPANLNQRVTVLLEGDAYRTVGKWQRLEIGRPVKLLKEQQHAMQGRRQDRHTVNIEGAYVEALLLDVYSGPGPTEIWIDDLEIGPLQEAPPPSRGGVPGVPTSIPGPRPASRPKMVEFNGNQLLVSNKPFFFRGIRHTDTPLRVLRETGFNTVFFDSTASDKITQEAVDLGFWLVPTLRFMGNDTAMTTAQGVSSAVSRFVDTDAVLFHHLGGTLASEQSAAVSRTAQLLRGADPGRPLGADVWDGLQPYSRSLQLVGIHRFPLMTTLELNSYREWLEQRRRLANPGAFVWTWVQTHLPEWHTHLLYNQSGALEFHEPVGPQSDQVRLMAYTAVAAGCKGLGFWSDRFLADSHFGRDRLLCVANLNMELDMIEPFILAIDGAPQWIEAKTPDSRSGESRTIPDIKAAVFHTNKGVLVLPIWQGKGAQFVPGQAAVSKLSLIVPQVPGSMQAWEVTPGEVRSMRAERVAGGMKITVPEFGLTTAIVFTSETSQLIRFQELCRARRQLVAGWSYQQAQYEFDKAKKIEDQLEAQGHRLPDGAHLMRDVENRLSTARQMWENHLWGEAYRESQRAMRPLRILMRAQWDEAVKSLDSPVASPFAVSFYTLPKHWEFMEQKNKLAPGANALPSGDFEALADRPQDGWRLEENRLDDVVEMSALQVGEVIRPLGGSPGSPPSRVEPPRQGKQCLMLQIKPRSQVPAPQALERAMLVMNSPPVRLEPGSLVQISGWVRIPAPITASPDGALLYDSAGGEPLAIRLAQPTPWKKFTLYRRVPTSGTISVTLALTGLGTVYFDDVRIEPLAASTQPAPPTSPTSATGAGPAATPER